MVRLSFQFSAKVRGIYFLVNLAVIDGSEFLLLRLRAGVIVRRLLLLCSVLARVATHYLTATLSLRLLVVMVLVVSTGIRLRQLFELRTSLLVRLCLFRTHVVSVLILNELERY